MLVTLAQGFSVSIGCRRLVDEDVDESDTASGGMLQWFGALWEGHSETYFVWVYNGSIMVWYGVCIINRLFDMYFTCSVYRIVYACIHLDSRIMMSVVALSQLFLVHRKLLHTRPIRCGGCHCQWRMLLFHGQHSWHPILESKHTTTMSYPKYVQLIHRYIPNIPVHYHYP